jgi:hypothetical protein
VGCVGCSSFSTIFQLYHDYQTYQGRKAWIRIRNTPVKPLAISGCLATETIEVGPHVCGVRLVVKGKDLNHWQRSLQLT